MFVLRWQSDTPHDCFLAHVFFLSVYIFDEGRHQGTLLYEIIGTCVVLEVAVQCVQVVVAARENYDEKGKDTGETLQATIA